MKNMYSIVLFLIAITSTTLFSCVLSNNDEEIVMVVDDHTSSMQTHTEIKGENNIQIGKFKLEDGRTFTLARFINKEPNCVNIDQPCGAFHWCCGDLVCNGVFNGRCHPAYNCKSSGTVCFPFGNPPCCPPSYCTIDPFSNPPTFRCA